MSYLYGKDSGGITPPMFADMLGQEVREGDFVCYAVRDGNTAKMKAGVVTEVKWVEKMDGGYHTWKVVATFESETWGTGPARVLTGRRPSEPARGRMVRVAKGKNW